jgi:N-succinyldiaminopimelate aminotransferase
MSIGEPQHAAPEFVLDTLRANLHRLGSYPVTVGLPELRGSCARWLERRFQLPRGSVNPETMVLPVNGTREALFAFVQAVIDDGHTPPAPAVVMPNPFYQIYEGAAILAGAEPVFFNSTDPGGFIAALDAVGEYAWRRCQVLFICSPGNPTGEVLSLQALRYVLKLADQHDFIVAADECYTDIYLDEREPPPGLLQAALAAGHSSFERCVVFHSLSKRSSVPGLRSGFVAGDPHVLSRFLLYRTYHGSAMAVPTQLASIAAWDEDGHAAANRALYQEKFDKVLPILSEVVPVQRPAGGFYVWADVGMDDERFARELFASQNVTVLPGSYLAREMPGTAGASGAAGMSGAASASGARGNPGAGRVRISLVPSVAHCIEAAERIRNYMRGHR